MSASIKMETYIHQYRLNIQNRHENWTTLGFFINISFTIKFTVGGKKGQPTGQLRNLMYGRNLFPVKSRPLSAIFFNNRVDERRDGVVRIRPSICHYRNGASGKAKNNISVEWMNM